MTRRFFPRFLRSFWQLLAGAACIAGGLAAIYLGWYGASHTRDVTDQMPYVISGGLLGAALIVLGGSFYFSFFVVRLQTAMRRQASALERVAERLDAVALLASSREQTPNGSVLIVAGGKRYHRSGCTLVAGKEATSLSVAEAQGRGLAPCRVCEPAGSPN